LEEEEGGSGENWVGEGGGWEKGREEEGERGDSNFFYGLEYPVDT
jgi:hypothetical protein